jgi:glycine/serine hydroxymethyltransferase
MREVAALIAQVFAAPADAANLANVRRKVQVLTDRFPLYRWKLQTVSA